MQIDLTKEDKVPIEQSGYFRLTGDPPLAYLLRRAHATVISNGSELERMIAADTAGNGTALSSGNECSHFLAHLHSDIKDFVYFDKLHVSKTALADAGIPLESKNKITVDGVWLFPDKSVLVCEYKDGDGFDTKKSDAEIKSLQKISKWMSYAGVQSQRAIMVLWNCPDLAESSVKSREAHAYLATANDFISLLPSGSLSKSAIDERRFKDREQNRKTIVEYLRDNIFNILEST